MTDPSQILRDLKPKKDFFVGLDSDGCVFDTMEIKQKECFIPNIVNEWGLQPVSKYVREAAEFVNLYSRWRGINRFPALLKVFDLLREREEVKKRKVRIPKVEPLRRWVETETKLGNPSLEKAVRETGDEELKAALKWSKTVNETVARIVRGVPPFPHVRESLEKISAKADIVVVSTTPEEALRREWEEHGIACFARIIAGQEMGTKKEHLNFAARGKYPSGHVLMVGDALGDLRAAKATDTLFYPVVPGSEEGSWKRFYDEAFDLFVSGRFAGQYEARLISEFEACLPEKPPWGA